MQFYPHKVSSTLVGSAVSSSVAATGSFVANFASIPVATASVALNIVGAAGTPGTSVSITGPKGATGVRGVTGFRGTSVFLLSSSWSGSSCAGSSVPCYGYLFGTSYFNGNQWVCDFGSTFTIYSTDPGPDLTFEVSPLYNDSICTDAIENNANVGAFNSYVWSTDANGTGSFAANCDISL